MNRAARKHPGRGFTLIEVLVTMVLMGIILPIAMQAVSIALNAASTARHTSEAASLAQAKINELLTDADVSSLAASGDFGQEWPNYQWSSQSTTDDLGFTQITVTVTWVQQGKPREYNLTTMISQDVAAATAGATGTSGTTGSTGTGTTGGTR
ncbi:MAG TPA: prepilin-type N-terminal cleavage/methylation domain-containing protein [Tepidisphaeraceae bacterium]|jgi:prepilin-type N-terminal cleavage/methylation domain-containing protein